MADVQAKAQPGQTASPYINPLPGGIPPTHSEHTESRTTILLPNDNTAFLNPPQQFNRDLSVAVIRAWNEMRIEKAREKAEGKRAKGKKNKNKDKKPQDQKDQKRGEGEVGHEMGGSEGKEGQEPQDGQQAEETQAGPSVPRPYIPRNIKILEALSATGLRSIRYAKEIPNVKLVLANDLSASACEAMKMNVRYNGVEELELVQDKGAAQAGRRGPVEGADRGAETDGAVAEEMGGSHAGPSKNKMTELPNGRRPGCKGRVRVNEGDACALMYANRDPKNRVDVVDLDPYGTAAPFIDAAISCVADGGLICVTCTDTAVMAGHNYPEKAFANYGGASVNAEYCHEVALRLVLNSVAQAAARYGRAITPLLCFSIDFYVRCFVMIDTAPIRVKELASQTGIVFVCSHCQSFETQRFGRHVDKKGNKLFKAAPKSSPGSGCAECGASQQLGGPMWLGPIQDAAFAERCLKSIEGQEGDYATWKRMHGMLSLAKEELADPFYFSCNKVSSYFKSSSAPSHTVISAFLNAGYNVSRSHALAGSIKTNAPMSFIHDIMREYIKSNPVKMSNIPDGNPAKVLLAKEQTHKIDFTPHADVGKLDKGEKVVFYQSNPLPNWGPKARAKNVKSAVEPAGGTSGALDGDVATEGQGAVEVGAEAEIEGGKRKVEGGDEAAAPVAKKSKVDDTADAEADEEDAMNMA